MAPLEQSHSNGDPDQEEYDTSDQFAPTSKTLTESTTD